MNCKYNISNHNPFILCKSTNFMNPFRILTTIVFFILCFYIYLCLSDASAFYYLPKLGWPAIIFAASFFYEKICKSESGVWTIILNFLIAFLCVVGLVCLKRFGGLPDNDPYSLGRFIYVFGTVFVCCLMSFSTMASPYFLKKIKMLKSD